MPEITESTPRDSITIAGETFKVPQPYSEGHVLTANEAAAINQTYAENLRNNFAPSVKTAKETNTFDAEVFQGKFDDYAEEYEFGTRRGGGGRGPGDPVEAEALLIAKDAVRQALRKKGTKLADVKAADITAKAREVLDRNREKIMERARQIVAARQAEDAGSIEVELETEAAAEAEPEAETHAKRGKKHAHSEG